MLKVLKFAFVLALIFISLELGAQNKSYLMSDGNLYDKSLIIIPTAEELISSVDVPEGLYVRTFGYYKVNDGGGGLFKIQKKKPGKSETVLYYCLANGLYANCMDSEVVLPRYGGVYVNQMLDNAKPFLRPGIRDIIVLPPSNTNHPGCSKYINGSGSPVCFWQVNAPVLFDDNCSYTEVYFHDEIVVAPEVKSIEAVLKIAGKNKPEDISFITPVYLEGRHIDEDNTLVAEHALLIEDGARIIFGKLQASYASNCITLGGGDNTNEIEFYATNIEASCCLKRGFNIVGNKKSVRFNVDKMQLQAPLGRDVTWIYAHGNVSQSSINTLFCALSGASKTNGFYRVFDLEASARAEQVMDFERIRISQCSEFGIISGGVYNIGSLILTASSVTDINIRIGKKTKILCDYIQLANPMGNNWMVTGKDNSSVLHINTSVAPPNRIVKGVVNISQNKKNGN